MDISHTIARSNPRGKARGFTLIEMLIVVAIGAILAAVAVPNYRDYLVRGALTEATGALSDARTRLEQFYADNRTYAGGGTGGCGITIANTEKFTMTCAPQNSGQAYLITATGSDASTNGFSYTINQQNTRTTVSWGANWGSVPAAGTTRWLIKK